jgi:hypothetical protein
MPRRRSLSGHRQLEPLGQGPRRHLCRLRASPPLAVRGGLGIGRPDFSVFALPVSTGPDRGPAHTSIGSAGDIADAGVSTAVGGP